MKKMRHALVGIAVIGCCAGMLQWTTAAMADGRKRPVLYEFIQQTITNHPALKASEAALAAARARARGQSRPIYNPALEVGYENAESTTKEIGISQAFDWSGKRRARSGVGRAEVEAAEATYELAYINVLTEIMQTLADYHTALLAFSVANEREILGERFLNLVVRQNEAGQTPRSELLTARLALVQARVAKNEAAAALSVAEQQLIATVGQDRQVWPKLEGEPLDTAIVADGIEYEQLPALRLARAETEIFRARIKVAKTDRMPDPTVGVRVGEEGRSSLVGLSVSLPIPVRNSFKAEVDAAGADLIIAQQNYYSVNRLVRARFDATQKRYTATAEAWQLWQTQGAEPLDEQRALLEKLLEAREISVVDYLVQLNQTFATETASIELAGRLWSAWFDWQNAGGKLGEWLETLQ